MWCLVKKIVNRVLSGIQPSGDLHLGNYLGALKNWVNLQYKFESLLFSIVDLHAITVPQEPNCLREATINAVATYISCGLNIQKSIIFTQSSVSEHSELCWLLSCMVPMGRLKRMTQFKDKTDRDKSLSSLGLYSYPVLMSADILLYKANRVPVGEDQIQHLELARDIANIFNARYSIDYFPIPEPMVTGINSRVMSLRDGKVKMSKSDPSDYSRINLSDSPDLIAAKVMKAKSDAILGFDMDTLSDRPEAHNLISIYAELSNVNIEYVCDEISDFFTLKRRLTDVLISSFESIRHNIKALKDDRNYVGEIIQSGKIRAKEIAGPYLEEIKSIIGIHGS